MSDTPAFLKEQAAVKRWNRLLEGVNDPYQRSMLATLMDNEARYMQEDATTMGDVTAFTTYAFPLIRRVYPALVANQLISIQPMTMPTGKIFYIDFKYGSDVAPIDRGDRNDYLSDQGATIKNAAYYSRGWVRGAMVGTGDGSETDFQLPSPITSPYTESGFTPLQDDTDLKIYKDSTSVPVVTTGTPTSGQVLVNLVTGAITFGTAPANAAVITADFNLRIRGDDSRIPELTMSMSSDSVSARTRKLKVRWEIEGEDDLRAYHGLSMERELLTHAADEMRREIDREIITDLVNGATAGNVNWSKTYDGTTGNAGDGLTKREYDETLVHAILDAEAKVYNKRLVRPNWLVTGPDVAVRLEKLNSFRLSGDLQGGIINEGPHLFGTLQNRFNVIVDPLFASNKVLVGYRGANFSETGYVYAPYVPLQITPRFEDPNDFTPRRGLRRRDAQKLISGDFYSTVTLT